LELLSRAKHGEREEHQMTQTKWFRFKPAKELWFVLLSWVLVTYSNIKDGLQMPFEATYGFILVIGLSAVGLIIIGKISKKMKTEAAP